jgi:hypothetical protein
MHYSSTAYQNKEHIPGMSTAPTITPPMLTQVSNILSKLGVASCTKAVTLVLCNRLVR